MRESIEYSMEVIDVPNEKMYNVKLEKTVRALARLNKEVSYKNTSYNGKN